MNVTTLRTCANDNHKWERFEEAVDCVLSCGDNYGELWAFLMFTRGVIGNEREKSANNFFWLVKFERGFLKAEVERRRNQMQVIE